MWRFITLFWSELLILLIAWFYYITKDSQAIFYLLISLVAVESLGNLTKIFFFKDRPIPVKYKNILWKALAWSFPSLHTMRVFMIFLFSLKYCIYYSPVFFVVYILVANSRIKLKRHFFVDTVGGTIYSLVFFVGFLLYLEYFL